MPLPPQLDCDAVIRALDPAKDVDGLHPTSLGYLAQGRPTFVPCTPKGCMRLLREVDVACSTGARAVVLGRSVLVGKPIALLLQNANATVTMCHSKTRDLADEVRRADIVVAAIGQPELVKRRLDHRGRGRARRRDQPHARRQARRRRRVRGRPRSARARSRRCRAASGR